MERIYCSMENFSKVLCCQMVRVTSTTIHCNRNESQNSINWKVTQTQSIAFISTNHKTKKKNSQREKWLIIVLAIGVWLKVIQAFSPNWSKNLVNWDICNWIERNIVWNPIWGYVFLFGFSFLLLIKRLRRRSSRRIMESGRGIIQRFGVSCRPNQRK